MQAHRVKAMSKTAAKGSVLKGPIMSKLFVSTYRNMSGVLIKGLSILLQKQMEQAEAEQQQHVQQRQQQQALQQSLTEAKQQLQDQGEAAQAANDNALEARQQREHQQAQLQQLESGVMQSQDSRESSANAAREAESSRVQLQNELQSLQQQTESLQLKLDELQAQQEDAQVLITVVPCIIAICNADLFWHATYILQCFHVVSQTTAAVKRSCVLDRHKVNVAQICVRCRLQGSSVCLGSRRRQNCQRAS